MNEKSAIRPAVRPFDWIVVGKTPCVVCNLRDNGDLEVVHNPAKPSNDEAFWDGEKWDLRPGYSGYADKYPRLAAFVGELKRGRFR